MLVSSLEALYFFSPSRMLPDMSKFTDGIFSSATITKWKYLVMKGYLDRHVKYKADFFEK